MENEKNYENLGQIGSFMLVGVEMMAADGKLLEVESSALIDGYVALSGENATKEHLDATMLRVHAVRNSFADFETKLGYIKYSMGRLGSETSDDLKNGIIGLLAGIAEADGDVDDNEIGLLAIVIAALKPNKTQ